MFSIKNMQSKSLIKENRAKVNSEVAVTINKTFF